MKVVGSLHSWSDIAGIDSARPTHVVQLRRYNRVLHTDRERCQLTVQSGLQLKHLIAHLYAHQLAMSNLGSVIEQTISGAISTGTHGTGITYARTTQASAAIGADSRGKRGGGGRREQVGATGQPGGCTIDH